MTLHASYHNHITLILLSALSAIAGPAIQFRADRSQTVAADAIDVMSWTSVDGAHALTPVHTNDIGWCAPSFSAGCVHFGICGTNGISPLQFSENATSLVSRAFIVADGTNSMPLATLLDAPAPLRLSPAYFPDYSWRFESSNTLGAASVYIDDTENDTWPPDGCLHLLEIAFDTPCPLSELHLGGHPATPDWNRQWEGCVAEFILLDDSVSSTGLSAIRSYLGLKWALQFDFETTGNARSILARLGVQSDPLYSSVLVFR